MYDFDKYVEIQNKMDDIWREIRIKKAKEDFLKGLLKGLLIGEAASMIYKFITRKARE